ncbi:MULTISPECIES: alpha/beta fold hydrolase [Burkholderia]|jgi:pimeloyl-ACP methyl ester carboxylesterase|uniref:Alpha/beta hydrolase fold family protein n=2 Tax=Burkholderiaceae TaxID=119060 RepID=A0AAW3F0Q4_BURGA|nr:MULTISPECIES: alpha/beta fold hydrolase [Burkholderia]AJW96646.1 alpha/beta hydrolase fold family protein [Burkholderia gladioli]ASD83177.1 alpha/beta hydrolase [Burkholderia gladioli pv. gladioli]AWY50606.1 alpha/beta hydrolase [Burkholderia gladioli pv. gladioli]AYQ89896.1 alpha/beta fold hydrolase [Burkholderia gladioli]KAF1059308.1 putative non-heme bromoperoxidase BpoC [Burkholderia gladioli]
MTPIVLIPGLLCTAEVFAPQIPALWPYGPVTVASTLEGDSIAAMAAAILASAPPRFALAGFSMGGYLAHEILRRAPERVTRLALLSTSARADQPIQVEMRQALLEAATHGDYDTVLANATLNTAHVSLRRDPVFAATKRRMAADIGRAAFARQTAAVIGRPDSRRELPSIAVPSLVLVGDSDPVTPPEFAREMAEAIPGAKLVIVPECGHTSPLERPEAVNAALRDWLAA